MMMMMIMMMMSRCFHTITLAVSYLAINFLLFHCSCSAAVSFLNIRL